MNKILTLLFLFTISSYSQKDTIAKKNEFKIDVYSLAIEDKIGLSYERELSINFSFGTNANYYVNKQMQRDFNNSLRNNIPVLEINPYIRYKITKNKFHYLYSEIFTSVNGGEYKEFKIYKTSTFIENGGIATISYLNMEKNTYIDFGIGGALGYKFLLKNNFFIDFTVGYGKNFNNIKSIDFLSRTGIQLGYTF